MSFLAVAAITAVWVAISVAVAMVFGAASLIGRRPGE